MYIYKYTPQENIEYRKDRALKRQGTHEQKHKHIKANGQKHLEKEKGAKDKYKKI